MTRSRQLAEAPADAGRSGAPSGVSRDDVGFLLAKASQRWNELLQERFTAAGFADVRPSYGSILVPLFEEDGLRPSELARRAGMTKQSMGELIRDLEEKGYVERRRDEADARATVVALTRRGREVDGVAAATIERLEREYARRLGASGLEKLKQLLARLVEG